MKVLLLIISVAFSQSIDDLRVQREKMFDYMAMAKNATHIAIRGEVSGVALTDSQIQELLDKAVWYESQVVTLITGIEAKAEVPQAIFDELDLIILEAPDWFYKTPREECVQLVESIIVLLEDGLIQDAIDVIDFLILNQEKYFYISYDRRPITVARFEDLKQQIQQIQE